MSEHTIVVDDLTDGGDGPDDRFDPDGRYEDRGPLGSGGMGEVRRVFDRKLGRAVAMKIIRWRALHRTDLKALFGAEARLTASLQHPGIVPVHDRGMLSDGRIWYTMAIVRGETLADAIRHGHLGDPEWTRRRLVDALEAASQAVAYAHDGGVLHRDLKPANIMVGTFGRVFVMDWGLATRFDGERAHDDGQHAVTQDASPIGTPAYMAPERWAGDRRHIGPPSDVFALGVVLWHVLLPDAAAQMPIHPTSARVPGGLPEALVDLATRSVHPDQTERPPDAAAFAAELRAWLDGARRREEALAHVGRADALAPDIAAALEEAAELDARAAAVLDPLPPHAPIDDKAPGWRLADEAAARRRDAAALRTRWEQCLRAALERDAGLAEAHQRLADHYKDQVDAALARRDAEAVARLEPRVREHDRGRHTRWLHGRGHLALDAAPRGAVADIARYVERDRRLVCEPVAMEVALPFALDLPAGGYEVCITAPGCARAVYPVWLDRGGAWSTSAPADGDRAVRLLRADALGPDDVFVPAGWCRVGGDPAAIDGVSVRRVWVDDLIVRRHPVTVAEYLAFLDDEPAWMPRWPGTDDPLFVRTSTGWRAEGDLTRNHWGPRSPMVLVTHAAARAYARWRAAADERAWRLPHDLEWEKAARGTDGRPFPWGDHFDPTRSRCLASTPGTPARADVDAHPDDDSPYGVRGMGGNVRDWCLNAYTALGDTADGERVVATPAPVDAPHLMVRGGSWSSSNDTLCRAATRFADRPGAAYTAIGLRLVRTPSEADYAG